MLVVGIEQMFGDVTPFLLFLFAVGVNRSTVELARVFRDGVINFGYRLFLHNQIGATILSTWPISSPFVPQEHDTKPSPTLDTTQSCT